MIQTPMRSHGEVRKFLASVSLAFFINTALTVAIVVSTEYFSGGESVSPEDKDRVQALVDTPLGRREDRLARLRKMFDGRRKRIEALKLPGMILKELGSITPIGVELEKVSLQEARIEIEGESRTDEEIGELMSNLSSSRLISDPKPISVREGGAQSIRTKTFSISAAVAVVAEGD